MKAVSVFFFFICTFFSVCIFSTCSAPSIWSINAAEFKSKIENGNTEFLRHIDYDDVRLEEIYRLGPGAAYALAHVFGGLEMEDMTIRMLELESEEGMGLRRLHASKELLSALAEAEEYEKLRTESERLRIIYSDTWFPLRNLAYASYRLMEDQETLILIDELRRRFPGESAADPELCLMEAVTSRRLNIAGWDRLFVEMFRNIPASGPVIRGYHFITDSPAVSEAFTPDELEFFEARFQASSGKYKEAAGLYLKFLSSRSGLIETEPVFNEMGTVLLTAEDIVPAAGMLKRQAREKPWFYGYFSSGRLYRKAGMYGEARSQFIQAGLCSGDDPVKAERSLWYRLDCAREMGFDPFVTDLFHAAETWQDPSFYTDILEQAAADLTAANEWLYMWKILGCLTDAGDVYNSRIFAYVLRIAENAGLVSLPYDDTVSSPEELDTIILAGSPFDYYSLMTSKALSIAKDEGTAGFAWPDAASSPEADFLFSLLTFRLFGDAVKYIRGMKDDALQVFTSSELAYTASRLSDAGMFREAIVLTRLAAESEDWIWDDRRLRLLYPRAFAPLIQDAAEENSIDVSLFTALVREESYFDADALSHAGAVGLAQLMPATAADTAERMGLSPVPDLRDPAGNLQLGAYYTASLLDRFDRIPLHAVCGYNAGPTRIRRWRESYGNLPPELLIELIPIRETRSHARKVLVSTVLDRYLYESVTPADSIQYYLTGNNKE